MVIHSSFADFILFLYVHISQADKKYDPTEIAVIKSKMTGLFSSEVDFEKKLYATIQQYNSFDKSKLTALFNDTFHHFSKEAPLQKARVYTDMHEIIRADGKVDKEEAEALETLKQIIELSIA